MKERIMKNKTLVIIVAAILVAGIGFGGGMALKSVLADQGGAGIAVEEAKAIALENAGVSSQNATFTKAMLDNDDSPNVYDIEFYTAQNEYDYEIDARSGDILEKSSEALERPVEKADTTGDAPKVNVPDQDKKDGYIGIAKAKEIALSHAGCHASSSTFTEANLDSDDGTKVYEIQFINGDHEYDYEINALTGKIIEHDSENMHHDD